MTPKQLAAITEHGNNLLAIFPGAAERDPVKLCKRLRRIEARIQARNIRQCNVGMDDAEWETIGDKALEDLDTLLAWKSAGVPVVINGDPRGYALKIDDAWMRTGTARLYTDWGGYGIIAPEIGPKGD